MSNNPLDTFFTPAGIANRYNNRSKAKRISVKTSWQILKEQQVQELKNVTPTKVYKQLHLNFSTGNHAKR